MSFIPGGISLNSESDNHYPEEAPAHTLAADGFVIDKLSASNEQFKRTVENTAYVTLMTDTARIIQPRRHVEERSLRCFREVTHRAFQK
jgi:formylglycine-generating enzyme required for sulfatase activity